jgi:shikimate dehydrogenase
VEIGASTRLLAVIGDPVEHSLSPTMHNAACRALGLDAVYVALRCSPAALPTLLGACAATGLSGNITVPHKEAAERWLTRKTELCARVGACNTFWSEGGELIGDNTDVSGVLGALRGLGVGDADRWLVIGTGGAARAVAIAAAQAHAELTITSRAPARASQFAAWARGCGVTAQPADGASSRRADVVINTTPLGLQPSDPLPLELSAGAAPPLRAALDMVYRPGETRWVQALRAAGVNAQDGREMLLQQGIVAFGRFFPETPAPVEVMRAALARALRA